MLFFQELVYVKNYSESLFYHSVRTAIYAKIIAEAMSLPDYVVAHSFEGGLMHDIGKERIPKRLIMSPKKLGRLEMEAVKLHIGFGIEKAKNRDMPMHIKQSISYHHERYDGKGYPYGLKGDEIPMHVYVISVADAFDAMTSNRPYQPNIEIEKAIIEVLNGAGSQFCSKAAEGLIDALPKIQATKREVDIGVYDCFEIAPIKHLLKAV